MFFSKTSVLRARPSARLLLETMEDRLTPSVDFTATLLSGAVPDIPAATSEAPVQIVDTSPVVIPLNHTGTRANLGWASGITGVTITGQALDAANQRLIQVGFGQDPVMGYNDLLVSYTLLADGTGQAFLYDMGVASAGSGVDVDSTGIVYVAGNLGGQGWATRLESDLATFDWAFTVGINLAGAKLDASATSLYVCGAAVGTHDTDVLAVKLTDLATGPTVVYSDIRSSSAGPSYASSITVDSQGRADMADSVIFQNQGRATYSPAFVQVEPDGTNKPAWGFLVNGTMNGVAVAPDDTWITVGNYKADTDLVQSTVAIKAVENIQGADINVDTVWGWIFTFNTGDASANSVAIDSAGNYYYAGSIDTGDPAFGIDMLYEKNSGDDGMTNLDNAAIDFGGTTDIANAITLDGLGNAYLAGTTNTDSVVVQLTNI